MAAGRPAIRRGRCSVTGWWLDIGSTNSSAVSAAAGETTRIEEQIESEEALEKHRRLHPILPIGMSDLALAGVVAR
jgi:hypothetical protein